MNTTSQPSRDIRYDFTGKRVVVTGISQGIGAAIAQAFGADMVQRSAGKTINLASMTSFIGGYRAPAYAASTGAHLIKAPCNERAGRGVNVNAIAPGSIDTELNRPLKADAARLAGIARRIPAGPWGAADAVADVALFLASDGARYMHGSVIPVDGGWLAR